tara:strand:- start:8427 stop:9086 length:660 start_codon:yes stop_codon:yes gene_type:complete
MIKRLKEALESIIESEKSEGTAQKIILLDPASLGAEELSQSAAPELRAIGLFSDVDEEKVAELVQSILYLDLSNADKKEEDREPIDFYVSTYGGSADDMFALYDIMRQARETTEIHTFGVGKVMSAGVLILAAGTKGKRKIGKNCRVMIHSVIGGNHGSLHNLVNEMGAIEQLQDMYIRCLVEETKMTETTLKNMLERKVNVYLSAEEAVELGIADIII